MGYLSSHQADALCHGRVEIADEAPPVGEGMLLDAQTVPGTREILHPVRKPGQAIPIPAAAIDPLLGADCFRAPILDVGEHGAWVGPVVVVQAVWRVVRPAAARFVASA